MKITSSEPKYYSVKPGKGLITSLGLSTIRRPKDIKKSRFTINNLSLKDISEKFKEFYKLPYEGYVRKSSKHMPTDN